MSDVRLQEIIRKQKAWRAGTRVTNCISHLGMAFDARPEDCKLCRTDIVNQLMFAGRVNEFLNELLEEVAKIAEEGQ